MAEPPGGPSVSDYLKALDARITKRRSAVTPEISAERWAYREAAAVLVTFDLTRLRPVGRFEANERASAALLLPDVMPAPQLPQQCMRMLNADVRKAALARLQSRNAIGEAIEANPDRVRDKFQELFEKWLAQAPPSLDDQHYLELINSAQIAAWVEGSIPNVPSLAEVQKRLNRRSVYALFEHLATSDFTGRVAELRVLREYVGVLEPTTISDSLLRQYSDWKGDRRRPPLIVIGAGGVGKSALLGKFLVDHAAVPEEARFPFAYLPLDNPFLRVEEPFTIIAEIRRQLELMHPDQHRVFERFDDENLAYRRQRRALDERGGVQGTRLQRAGALQETELSLYEAFAAMVNALCVRPGESGVNAPFLLVLDTFEEAQYRGAERLIGLTRMLAHLHRMCGTLRIVICTRPPFQTAIPTELGPPQRLDLRELARTDAQLMLTRLGVADTKLADTIARQVGGNPLNLRLAARLVEHHDTDTKGIQGIQTTSYLLFAVSAETIRGQLYSRLLQHIHDPDVRALAHPGMVLRRVTPDVIREVLAGPCGVDVPTRERAEALFNELAREHTLLEPGDPGALRYRTDIRQATLALLQQDRPAKVREIHLAAVAFYFARQDDGASRAEELYHRLALEEDPAVLNERWEPSSASSLLGALSELPPRAQAWLAGRVGIDLPAEARELASNEEWEQLVGRKVRDLLRYTEAARALELLRERTERMPASPMYAFEAKALMFLDRFDEALSVLQRGIDSIPKAPNRGRLAELLWLTAQAWERKGNLTEAAGALERAEAVAENITDPFCRLQILAQQLLLRSDRRARFATDDTPQLRDRLAAVFSRIPDGDLDRERSLTRIALALIGPGYINDFARGVRAVGVGRLDAAARREIADCITSIGEAATESEVAALIDDLRHESIDASQLIDRCLRIPAVRSAVAPALLHVLNRQPHSLEAANLSGIDEYRQPWELELPQEAA